MKRSNPGGAGDPDRPVPVLLVRMESLLAPGRLQWERRLGILRAWTFKGSRDTGPLPVDPSIAAQLAALKEAGQRLVLVSPFAAQSVREALGPIADLFDEYATESPVHSEETFWKQSVASGQMARTTLGATIRALRPHQWAKNILVALPLLTGQQFMDAAQILRSILAIIAFCLCASAIYVINDLIDLPQDRRHPRKSRRPFAAGRASIRVGLLMVPILLAAAAAAAAPLPAIFWAALGLYFFITIAYSFALKRIVLLDVIILAGLYTLRLVAGSFAIGLPPSDWLLAFSMFIFLSLALLKRYGEVINLAGTGKAFDGRGYQPEDSPLLLGLGASAGYLSVLVFALYINSPSVRVLYARPDLLWLLCPLLLFWVSRAWLLSHRGRMPDDPVIFALKDRISLMVLGLMAAIMALAI